jgi:hypothetical protein
MATELKKRHPPPTAPSDKHPASPPPPNHLHHHPRGAAKHGTSVQALRMLLFFVYFTGGCIA